MDRDIPQECKEGNPNITTLAELEARIRALNLAHDAEANKELSSLREENIKLRRVLEEAKKLDRDGEVDWAAFRNAIKALEGNKPCGKKLIAGNYWERCGDTDMGQTAPVLCKKCDPVNGIALEEKNNGQGFPG